MKFFYDRGILRIKTTNASGFGNMYGPDGTYYKAYEI